MKKKYIIILSLIIILLLVLSIYIYPTEKNNKYKKELINNIYQNTNIKNIKYLNKDNNYYIVKTNNKVIVLDLNYEQVDSVDINKIKESTKDITYRRGNIYYEEKIKEKEKLIYNFYNIETEELEYQISLGGEDG